MNRWQLAALMIGLVSGCGRSPSRRRPPTEQRAMVPDDQMAIGHITQTIVAAQVVQLVERGTLRLDDMAADLLPADLEFDPSRATVADPISYRSGIADTRLRHLRARIRCVVRNLQRAMVRRATQHCPDGGAKPMNQRPSFGWMGRIGLGLTLAACSAAGPVAPSPTPSVTSTASPAPTVTTAPTASPVATLASSSSPAVLARGTFQNKGATVELDATGSGSSVHGHMTMSASDYSLTVELECARTFDAFLLIGGDVTQSTLGSVPVGTRVAMVIKRGSPLQAHPDFENPDPPEATCMAYLEEIDEARASDQLDPISDIELGP